MHNMIIYLICGTLGVLLHSLIKMQAMKKKADAINMKFVPTKYFEDDWIGITISFVSFVMIAFFLPDITKQYPKVADFSRILFGFSGYIGSTIIQGIFGRTAQKISDLAEIKNDNDDKP